MATVHTTDTPNADRSIDGTDGAAIAERLAESIGRTRFQRLIEPAARFEVSGDVLRVLVRSEFHKSWLHRKLESGRLEAAFAGVAGAEPREILWEVSPDGFPDADTDARNGDAGEPAPATQDGGSTTGGTERPSDNRTNRAATRRRFALSEFIVGDSNRLAYNAALEMARSEPGDAGASALFLHGDCGVGKTHLLNGVVSEVLAKRPGARVRCVTGEAFANEYISAVHRQDFDSFRARYRGLELLCVDDVHFLAGKTKTMGELLHTFDALDLDGARVVLASDEHPKRIERLSQRLVSRCVSGMVVRIQPPNPALRERLAQKMAARRGLTLSDEAVRVIANACLGSVREIEGAVIRIEAYERLFRGAAAGGGSVSADAVRRALGETAHRRPARPVRVSLIAQVVCEELGVELSELFGRGKHSLVVLARELASTLAREMTTQSFPEIARALNRRNHSTVVTACQRMQRSIERGDLRDAGPQHGLVHPAELKDRLREIIARRSVDA